MNQTNVPAGLTQSAAESELDSGTSTTLTAADSTSTDRLATLGLVQQARISQLSRTVTNLSAQYGSGSMQVAAAQAAATTAQGIVDRLQIVRQQAAATPPTVTATGWAVWGHVYDSSSKPLSGYCVFLVDRQKNYQSAYGFAFTDKDGSFTINYAGGPAGTKTAATVPTVFLAVTNDKAQPVYVGSNPLPLVVGTALYVDTTLAAGEPVLGDLPEEIRKVALPPSGDK